MERYLGIDVGGTKVAVGVVSDDGRVLSQLRATTDEVRAGGDPLRTIIEMGRVALAAAGDGPTAGVGIGLPGPVDYATVTMLAAPTIPELHGVSLAGPLADAFGCPAAGDNDANGAALAEARFGAGRGREHVVYMTVSTGIGGGIVTGGRVFRGARGTSAEFGHQVVQPVHGPPCDCGGSGCLETLASGRGIARAAKRLVEALPPDERPLWAREPLTGAAVADAVRRGDPLACRAWETSMLYLGLGLSNVINLLDPDVIVLGGGVAVGSWDLLLSPVERVVQERCMPTLRREVPLVRADLGAEVGIIGAACLAMEG
jgi:glucokinase